MERVGRLWCVVAKNLPSGDTYELLVKLSSDEAEAKMASVT